MPITVTERPWHSLMWFTDCHISSTNPISRKDNYPEAILSKLDQIVQASIKLRVDRLICGGDIWHHKAPSKIQHWTISRLIDIWKQHPPIGIIGNHDMSWNSLDYLSRQPMGVVIRAGAYEVIDHPESKKVGPFRIKGINYRSEVPEDWFQISDLQDNEIGVLILHVNASRDGSFLGDDICYSYDFLASKTNAKIVCLGHWHKDQGVQEVKGVHFVNVGSIARNSLREDNLGRTPKCALIRANADTLEIDIHQIILKHKPDDEVFDVISKRIEKASKMDIKNFMDRLETGGLFSFDVNKMIEESNADKKVKDEAKKILDEVSH